MAWNIIRNGEPDLHKITLSGTCQKCGEMAEVTTFFCGSMMHKMDLQKTYHFSGYKCSLQGERGYSDPACKNTCPLIQKELL